MIGAAELASLSPQQRARVIYATAESELNNQLWQAALGNNGSSDSPLGGSGKSASPSSPFNDLLQALQATAAPRAAPSPAPADAVVPAGTVASSPAIPQRCMLGANARYQQMVEACAQRTGVPSAAIAAIVNAEAGKHSDGSWNPLSRNPRSSAAGLGQFLTRTWIGIAETRGTSLNQAARSQGWLDAKGKVRADARGAVLAMRYDPGASIQAVGDFARLNLDRLESHGVPARENVTTIARAAYLSHQLGAGDAMKFLKGQIAPDHARVLLGAQIGAGAAARQIGEAGGAIEAHRRWLLAYIDRNVQPARFQAS